MFQSFKKAVITTVSLSSFFALPFVAKADGGAADSCWQVFQKSENASVYETHSAHLSEKYPTRADAKQVAAKLNGHMDGYNYGYEQCSAHVVR